MGDTDYRSDQADHAEQNINQAQPRNASAGTAPSTLLYLDHKRAVLSSNSPEPSTENLSLECTAVTEKQSDQVSVVRKSDVTGVHGATVTQKSTPLVRSGHISQTIPLRRTTLIGLSEPHEVPEKTRAMTVYDADVTIDHTHAVNRYVMYHTTEAVC